MHPGRDGSGLRPPGEHNDAVRFAPELAGPSDPLRSTPARPAGSVRRTTTIDVSRPEGVPGPLLFDARGRDLVTAADGEPAEADLTGSAGFTVPLDVFGALGRFEPRSGTTPPDGLDLAALEGTSVANAFRKALAAEGVHDSDPGGLWHLLLDDLVGARIVAGLAQQYEETLEGGGPMHDGIYDDPTRLATFQGGICAGWAVDATMLAELDRTGDLPVSVGPVAPPADVDDQYGWHPMAPLAAHSIRRRRRLDLGPIEASGLAALDVHFRDSHVDGDGLERVVHEYSVEGFLDVGAGVVAEASATSRVLPWPECPAAEASASRVAGVPLAELRDHVRTELRGVSTCTHLNDVLRSLADLGPLAASLPH